MQGHARQRGKVWELRAYVGRDPVTGKKKYLTHSFPGGNRAANEELARFVAEVGGDTHAAQGATVGDLVERWFEMAKPDLSPTTVRGYARNIETYIIPAFGSTPLARLKTAQLDQYYARLLETGGKDGSALAPASVRQVHAILRRALTQGVTWGWIAGNPAVLASPPKVRRQQLELPEPAEVVKLIAMAEASDPDLGCFLRLAATSGARRGELCGLRWQDVDLDAPAVTIERSVVEGEHGAIVEKDTKTHTSRRIALDALTAELLAARRTRAAGMCLKAGGSLKNDAFVFSASADCRRPWEPSAVSKAFARVRRAAGLGEFRLHDLRHFVATRLLASGVSVRTVSGRLGHSNAATTLNVYAHFVAEADRDAADTIASILSDQPQVQTKK